MALPVLTIPTYELEVPSTDEKIKYRPFLVKEEKILLIALESGENEDIIRAVTTIVDECTFNKLKLGKMPMFDVEYIFLQIRAKSVGEISTLKLLCPDDGETYAKAEIDLTEIQVQVDEEHNSKVELTDEMGIIMQYPNMDSMSAVGITDINASNMLDVIVNCIEQIYDKGGEEVHMAVDSTKKELLEFFEQLNTTQFAEVQKFFDTMPKLTYTVEIENPKTKVKSKVTLNGLNDFFE
jgi:hypothetical protein